MPEARRHRFGGAPDGQPVERVVLGSEPGPVLHVLTLGATAHRLEVACGDGRRRNVLLGHATVADYLASTAYVGATVGRYANRIRRGRFEVDGVVHQVGTNDRGNQLHGGPEGFDARVWELVELSDDRVVLRLESPDGDQGFPGHLTVHASYAVGEAGVRIELTATTDAATPVNLTNHAYFNLDGDGSGTIDGHLLTVPAACFTPIDEEGVPEGEHRPVAGTPFDLREPRLVGEVVSASDEQLARAGGVDHNFVVDGTGLRTHAVLESPRTRTRLEVRSDQPGVQVYTGNFLDGSDSSTEGVPYDRRAGLALEPQLFPDSPNHPEWPSSLLRPGETYRHTIEWMLGPAGA